MIKFRDVCLNCPDRIVGCHSICERYKAAKKEHMDETERIRSRKLPEKDIDAFKKNIIKAMKNSVKKH